MPEILAGIAVILLIVALGFGLALRTAVARISLGLTSDLDRVSQALGDLRGELAEVRRELAEVRAATEAVPVPPPLPKARTGRLDDLREQLRAAHRESEAGTDD